jgi:hypothetical protein
MTEVLLPEVTVRHIQITKPWSMRSNASTLLAVTPGNVVVVVPDRKSRCSSLECFIDRLKVLGNGAGSAGLGDGIFYMIEREIEASTEVAQTLFDHSKGH